jgi:hypothetical protein
VDAGEEIAWVRDQKLNSNPEGTEGTTGIHAIDLLGRRSLAANALAMLREDADAATAATDRPGPRDASSRPAHRRSSSCRAGRFCPAFGKR